MPTLNVYGPARRGPGRKARRREPSCAPCTSALPTRAAAVTAVRCCALGPASSAGGGCFRSSPACRSPAPTSAPTAVNLSAPFAPQTVDGQHGFRHGPGDPPEGSRRFSWLGNPCHGCVSRALGYPSHSNFSTADTAVARDEYSWLTVGAFLLAWGRGGGTDGRVQLTDECEEDRAARRPRRDPWAWSRRCSRRATGPGTAPARRPRPGPPSPRPAASPRCRPPGGGAAR